MGVTIGYPAIVLDPDGPAVSVLVFESQDLPQHWGRLDEFEGSGYERVVVGVSTQAGNRSASIYALRQG